MCDQCPRHRRMGDSDEGVSESAYELTLWGAFLLIFVILIVGIARVLGLW